MLLPGRRALVVVGAGVAVAAGVAGCGGDRSPHTGRLTTTPCDVGGVSAGCATVTVAEDPGRPLGPKIPIRVAVVPAWGDRATDDPLFYLAGWGSAGVSDDLATAVPMLHEVNRTRDLVFVDQRGTGASNRLRCAAPAADPYAAPRAPVVSAIARRCAQGLGPRLRFYTTTVAADDLEQVRRAIGAERINLYGGSYGATLAQVYLAHHGSHVRSAVLDGGSLLDVRIFERGPANAQGALDRVLERCAADAPCHAAFPHPAADYARIIARLRRGPTWMPDGIHRLDRVVFADTIDQLLVTSEGKAIIPAVLHLAATRQLSHLSDVLVRPATAGPLAYQLVIECSEPWASRRPDAARRGMAGSFLAPSARRDLLVVTTACREFPHGLVSDDLGRRVRSTVPVLLLTGAEDPADPPANVAGARRELPNSRTVVFAGAGHGQLELPCAQRMLARFVERGTASGLDTACAATAALRPFDLGQ